MPTAPPPVERADNRELNEEHRLLTKLRDAVLLPEGDGWVTLRNGRQIVVDPEFRWLSALVAMTAVSTIAALVVGDSVGIPAAKIILSYAAMIWLMAPPTVLIVLVGFLATAALKRSASPIGDLKPFLAARFGSPMAAAGTIVPILVMPLLMGAFGTLKQVIPLVNPFGWDDAFARADRILFLGWQPWELTHALFGSPLATVAIDRIYTLWVMLLFVAVLSFALFAPTYLRARFFVSFGAGWLLIGGVGAFLLSSAGPCYADLVGASAAPEFATLMERLRTIHAGYHLGAVDWQSVLWKAHDQQDYGFGKGISAMPSMHNAVTFLYLLATARAPKHIRAVAWLFTAVIFIGSIHLGWHYAADGLVAWAAMAAIWWGAGVYLRSVGYAPVQSVESDGATEPAGAEPAPTIA